MSTRCSGSRGVPSEEGKQVQHKKPWETFDTGVLWMSIEVMPSGEEIVKYVLTGPGASRNREGGNAISVSHMKTVLSNTIRAIEHRSKTCKLTAEEIILHQAALEVMERLGRLTRARVDESTQADGATVDDNVEIPTALAGKKRKNVTVNNNDTNETPSTSSKKKQKTLAAHHDENDANDEDDDHAEEDGKVLTSKTTTRHRKGKHAATAIDSDVE